MTVADWLSAPFGQLIHQSDVNDAAFLWVIVSLQRLDDGPRYRQPFRLIAQLLDPVGVEGHNGESAAGHAPLFSLCSHRVNRHRRPSVCQLLCQSCATLCRWLPLCSVSVDTSYGQDYPKTTAFSRFHGARP
ncbi:hypothetical protein [Blastomonas sp.]|uniref:hypothetical protein n=1 Tax=Blastomonas sp. TaxID=1909299 RepID=UPI002590EED3|nr:hypothetical protein [Blastomonas sp.]